MTISQAVQELYKKYVQATKMEHIHNPLAWALFKVWRMADGKRNARKLTNFDRIKAMSVDEMAEYIISLRGNNVCGFCCNLFEGDDEGYCISNYCYEHKDAEIIVEWLESEVDEDA